MNEIIGFGRVNDFTNIVLRSKLSKKYGLFGEVPMWGGVKLHKYYPPLSTVITYLFNGDITGSLLIYFLLTASAMFILTDYVNTILFLVSFYHIVPLLHYGRYAELLGYGFVLFGLCFTNPIIAGIFLGLCGLTYPISFIFGLMLFLIRFNVNIYIVAFIVCGWWYVRLLMSLAKGERIRYLHEQRSDKIFGFYKISILSMVNILMFLFLPWQIYIFGVLIWVVPFNKKLKFSLKFASDRLKYYIGMFSKPYRISDLLKALPKLDKISEKTVLISQNSKFITSLGLLIWGSACYLLDKGIIVYNGLPPTEIGRLEIPKPGLPTYSVEGLT